VLAAGRPQPSVADVRARRQIWSYFATWLNILVVLIPPIGIIIIIMDRLVFARRRSVAGPGVYWKPFAAWVVGAGVVLVAHYGARALPESIVAMLTGQLRSLR
jgi:cytosine permease